MGMDADAVGMMATPNSEAPAMTWRDLHARGNASYQAGRFEQARAHYSQAIAQLQQEQPHAHGRKEQADGDGGASITTTLAQLYSNRAQTYTQERNFAPALQDAVRALDLDPDNEKARLRQLVALENLERFETALQAVNRVLDDPLARTRHVTLFEYALVARRRLRKTIQLDRAVASEEDRAVHRMVHENQQMRINFGCLIPSRIVVGEFFDVSVNIGNEFGLFRRDFLSEGQAIELQAELRGNQDHAFRVTFRECTTTASGARESEPPCDDDGCVLLNDRGRALFRMAIVANKSESGIEVKIRANMALALAVHPRSARKWNLLPIVSLPFTVASIEQNEDNALDQEHQGNDLAAVRLGVHCCRPMVLPALEQEILLAESPGNLGIGGKLWDSCLVLTQYLTSHRELLKNKGVVELGSGLGLVGIYCAMLGAQVTLTDMEEVVPLLEYNLSLNFPENMTRYHRPFTAAHMWGTPLSESIPSSPDVVVMSDVVYDPEGYAPLVDSLRALARSHTTILMAHRSRNPKEHEFFELLGKSFTFELVDWGAGIHQDGSKKEDGGGQERALQDVKIFRIVLKL